MRCAADLGGTNLRLQFYLDDVIISSTTLKTLNFSSFDEALRSALPPDVSHFSCSVAGPVRNGSVRCGNLKWPEITEEGLKQNFKFKTVHLLNDLHAAALALQSLPLSLRRLRGEPGNSTKLLVGVGTGIGVSLVCESVIPTECGWATFAPRTREDLEFAHFVKERKGLERVAVEHVTAGPSVSLWYEFFGGEKSTSPEDVYLRMDEFSIKAIDRQWKTLGRIIAEWCMMFNCTGGVYMTGGVVDKAATLIDTPLVEGFTESLGEPASLDAIVNDCALSIILTSDLPLKGAKLILT